MLDLPVAAAFQSKKLEILQAETSYHPLQEHPSIRMYGIFTDISPKQCRSIFHPSSGMGGKILKSRNGRMTEHDLGFMGQKICVGPASWKDFTHTNR